MGIAIEARNLVKRYVTKKRIGLLSSRTEVVEALRGVSFVVRHGEVVGLLGPNGAGKTTTVKMLATLLIPDAGEARVEGFDVVREVNEVRKRIGIMLSVEKGFYGKLTGRENLEYFGALYGIPEKILRQRIDELLKLLELDRLGGADRLFEEFSLGMRARLALARALLRDPPVLLLDEPTLGLDPPTARRIRGLVRELARQGKAILYTTHNMFEAEIVCDRVLLINRGVIVAQGTPEELKSRIPKMRTLEIHVKSVDERVVEKLRSVAGQSVSISQSSEGLPVLRIVARRPEEIVDDVIKLLTSNNIDIVRMRIEEPTLEDVFLYFTSGGGDGSSPGREG